MEAVFEAVLRLFPNSASRLATEVCQGSKWGRILPGMQWAWSQTRDTCLTRVDTCLFLTLLPDELQGSVRGQNGVEFRQEFNGHGPRHLTFVRHMSALVQF